MKKLRWLLVTLLIASLAVVAVGCNNGGGSGAETDEFTLAAEAVDTYLTAGKPANITVQDVYNNVVVSGDDDYAILSVRSAEHYAAGHVEGAVNIPYAEMYKQENLDQLDPEKTTIVYCYTGNTGSQITALLNVLGYDAVNMKFGMMAWNEDALGIAGYGGTAGFPVVEGADEAADTYELPVLETGEADVKDILKARAEAYLTSGQSSAISPEDLYNNVVVGGDDSYQIVSLQSAEDYAVGHIDGAINIPFAEVGKVENLKRIDPSKKIAVYCYTGHTGAQTTMLLNLLGYEAYNVKFGMAGWNQEYSSYGVDESAGLPVVTE